MTPKFKQYPTEPGWYIEYIDDNYYRHVYIGKPKVRNDKDCKDSKESSSSPFLV